MEQPEDVLQFEPDDFEKRLWSEKAEQLEKDYEKRLHTLMESMRPETVLQPSLHSLEELGEILCAEAESRGLGEFEDGEDGMGALQAIGDAGYYVVDEDDCILIFSLEDSEKLLAVE